MTRKKVKQTKDPLRREAILDAALKAFTTYGYSETTLAMICEESGSSVGSVYHFFSGKAEIAYDLICKAIEGWSEESGDIYSTVTDARATIQGSVSGLLNWANKNEALFYFMEEMRAKAATDPEFTQFDILFTEGQTKAAQLYRNWAESGLVKEMPWSIAYALMMGPAYLFLRAKRSGRRVQSSEIQKLASMAWESVRQS